MLVEEVWRKLVEKEIRGQVNQKEDAEERSMKEQEGGEKGIESEPLNSCYKKGWVSHCRGWNPFQGAGGGGQKIPERPDQGVSGKGKVLGDRQAGCMVQGQNQGSISLLRFQKAVPDLVEPLPKASSNPG